MKRTISALLLITLLLLTFTSCKEDYSKIPYGTGASEYATSRNTEGRDTVYVEMLVDGYDKVLILLDRTTAPITVDNFVKLVNKGFYDGLTFHRLMKNFMIQGGDPLANGRGDSGSTIKGEFASNGYYNDIEHKKGVISMGRNAYDYNSASCQFFIMNADSPSLDGDYASFGYVVKGLDVIDAITNDYIGYANPYNNYTISDKSNQPKIIYIKVVEG